MMHNLSEYTKQFSKKSTEDSNVKEFNDYRPPQGFIRFFSSNNGTVVSAPGIDGSTDKYFIPRQYDTELKEVSEKGLADFINMLNYKAQLRDGYNIHSFETYTDPVMVKAFSVKIKEYVKEKLRNPRIVYDYRIRQFVSYMNATKPEVLSYSMYYAVQYLKEYFEQYLTAAMNGLVNPNIMMGLNIAKYIQNKQLIRVLQRYLRKASKEIQQQGAMMKLTQKRLWDSFREAFLEFMTGVSYRIKDPVKRNLLVEAVAGSAKPLEAPEGDVNAIEEEEEIETD